MHMFGGFTGEFFDAYHKIIPRCEPHYNERIKLYELYHQYVCSPTFVLLSTNSTLTAKHLLARFSRATV